MSRVTLKEHVMFKLHYIGDYFKSKPQPKYKYTVRVIWSTMQISFQRDDQRRQNGKKQVFIVLCSSYLIFVKSRHLLIVPTIIQY